MRLINVNVSSLTFLVSVKEFSIDICQNWEMEWQIYECDGMWVGHDVDIAY